MDRDASNWLQVGELTTGFGGNELAPTSSLLGRSLAATFEGSVRVTLAFQPSGEVKYSAQGSGELAEVLRDGLAQCTVTSPRPQIFLVDFLPSGYPRYSISLVVDFAAGIGTAVFGRLPLREETKKSLYERACAGEELTAVVAQLLSFTLSDAAPAQTNRHQPATDLIGRRMLYVYGPRDTYEHVYLNERYYTWQCLRGPERGLADTDLCYCRKVADQLYLFVWLEKIVPTLGVVLVDTEALHSTGKIFGYRGDDFGAVANAHVGARAQLLNVTNPLP